ncbi:MAG: AAA family ATPase, partial [Acidobacteria bacterium]|nr:AAA family ATPase [Acidobacteriota bacterium]
GQCIEHYGAGEAYLPVLEALGRLGRRAEGAPLIQLLRRQAPSWLVQMPSLIDEAELEVLSRRVYGTTQERMARELAEALEALTADWPLVLWLEDLHWSDYSTVELLAMLARRREPARLLVVGSYRPAQVIVSDHPLRTLVRELPGHGQCEELALGCLTLPDVISYLAARLALGGPPATLQGWGWRIHESTDGNPLFMVLLVDNLLAQGVIGEARGEGARLEEAGWGLPESLRQLIEMHLERLSQAEQQVLEVGSVAGAEFTAVAVAACLGKPLEQVEERCEALVRRGQWLRGSGSTEWPDGTLTGRYGFLHALYQNVLYRRLATTRRLRLHQRIGERLEQGYGERVGEVAAELAVHFEEGRDTPRAVHYRGQAAQNALRRSAHREAIDHLTQGLELLKTLPDTPERTQQEIRLETALGLSLTVIKGFAASEMGRVYTRARELCQQSGATSELPPVLWGLWNFRIVLAEFQAAYELGEELLTAVQRIQDPAHHVVAHQALGSTLFHLGEFAAARAHLEQGIAVYDPRRHRAPAFLYAQDPGVACRSFAAPTLCLLGYPDQALQRSQEARALAEELSHPFSKAFALFFSAWLHQFRREPQAARECAEGVLALAQDMDFFVSAWQRSWRGWALAEQGQAEEGIEQIRQGLNVLRGTGARIMTAHFLALMAEACERAGRTEEGLGVLAEALAEVDKTGERYYEAELYRLKGELTLKQSRGQSLESEAEECFRKAIEVARRQSAKSLELQAVVSLSRLWQRQGKKEQARQRLAEIYGWFTEGFETKDLQEARALLQELA